MKVVLEKQDPFAKEKEDELRKWVRIGVGYTGPILKFFLKSCLV